MPLENSHRRSLGQKDQGPCSYMLALIHLTLTYELTAFHSRLEAECKLSRRPASPLNMMDIQVV